MGNKREDEDKEEEEDGGWGCWDWRVLGAVAVGDHPSDSGTDSRDREGTDQHIFS